MSATKTTWASSIEVGDRIEVPRLGTMIPVRVTSIANAGVYLILAWVDDFGQTGSQSLLFRSLVQVAR